MIGEIGLILLCPSAWNGAEANERKIANNLLDVCVELD